MEVINTPTAQQQGLDVAHDPAWQQRGPQPTVDPLGAAHGLAGLMHLAGMFDNMQDSRGTPNKPSGYAIDNVPLHVESMGHLGLSRQYKELLAHPERMINGVEPFFWGSAYNPATDSTVNDMLDGPKMYTPRGAPDTSLDAVFRTPDLSVNPREISLDNHSAVWTYDNTYAGWNDRLLFDPSPVDPYGPSIPGLFDDQFQPTS